jgi:hypothetical protein
MFHPDTLPGVRIRPARDVARGVDPGSAGLEALVHDHAAVNAQPRAFCQVEVGANADSHHDEIRGQTGPVLERHHTALDTGRLLAQMKADAMLFMEPPDEVAQLRAHHALQRPLVRRHDMYLELSGTQGRGHFESNEARAQDHRTFGFARSRHDRLAIRKTAEIVDLRFAPLHLRRESDRGRASGEE